MHWHTGLLFSTVCFSIVSFSWPSDFWRNVAPPPDEDGDDDDDGNDENEDGNGNNDDDN